MNIDITVGTGAQISLLGKNTVDGVFHLHATSQSSVSYGTFSSHFSVYCFSLSFVFFCFFVCLFVCLFF